MCTLPQISQFVKEAYKLGYSFEFNDNNGSIKLSNVYGAFCLRPLESNSFIAESYGVYINQEFRGQGFGQQQHLDRLTLAKAGGLRTLLATVKNENLVERHILSKNGWNELSNDPSIQNTFFLKELF